MPIALRTALLVALVLVAAPLLAPAGVAPHGPIYFGCPITTCPSGPLAYSAFEGAAPAGAPGNQNGPVGEERRPIPTEEDVPARFRGLLDTLVVDWPRVDRPGRVILDHHMYGSLVESGQVVPFGQHLASTTGAPRTTPTSMHFLWHGWWNDMNGDGVIDEQRCGTQHTPCSPIDEFTWRGAASGDDLVGLGWIFPGDYNPSSGTGGHDEPSSLAGDCGRWAGDNAACVDPGPDFEYYDGTVDGGGNSRWVGDYGGGQWTPEEFLLVSQHVVSIVGPPSLVEDSAYGYFVECTLDDGCMRDYDWYDSMAADDVESLYRTAMRGVRDVVYLPARDEATALFAFVNRHMPTCPRAIPGEFGILGEPTGCYDKDANAHNEAVAGANANGTSFLKTWAFQAFRSVIPAYASTPSPAEQDARCRDLAGGGCPVTFPKQGFYGDFWVDENLAMPYSSYAYGAWVRPEMHAWFWDDANGDGTIGTYDADRRASYDAGLADNPNDGLCDRGKGGSCELLPAAGVYAGGVVAVTPGPGGWPPGSYRMRHYEDHWAGPPLGVGPEPWLDVAQPLVGTEAATLRADAEGCTDASFSCRTVDALFLPSGSAFGLHGQVVGGVTVAWSEDDEAYAVTWPGAFAAGL